LSELRPAGALCVAGAVAGLAAGASSETALVSRIAGAAVKVLHSVLASGACARPDSGRLAATSATSRAIRERFMDFLRVFRLVSGPGLEQAFRKPTL